MLTGVTNEDTLYYDERPIETILLQPNLLQAKENKTNQWATVIQECKYDFQRRHILDDVTLVPWRHACAHNNKK